MKKKVIKQIYKKWWFWLILIFFILFLIIEIYMYLLHINVIHRSIKCDEPHNLVCVNSTGVIKDKIPCSSDEDCGWKPVREYCAPGEGSFTYCIGEKDYCGEDGFCKQCRCL